MKRWLSVLLGLVMALPVCAGELAERLKGPNHVLLMRHAYAPGVGDPPGYSLDKCESQRILNDEGKQQSVRIGQWLRRQAPPSRFQLPFPSPRNRSRASIP